MFVGVGRLLPLPSPRLPMSEFGEPPHREADQRHLQHRRGKCSLSLRQHRALRQPEEPQIISNQLDKPLPLFVQIEQPRKFMFFSF